MTDKLHWYARRLFAVVGWPAMAGIAVAAGALAAYLHIVQPLESNIADLRDETAGLRGKIVARRLSRPAQDPAAQLTAFYGFFPGDEGIKEALAKLYDAAEKQNVVLEQGEYHLAPEHDGKLARYDIVLPVKGPYPKLRAFIAQALKDNPSLALDGVSFNRQGAIDIGVSAEVRLTLYLRGTSS